MSWQPIETAPKDRRILVAYKELIVIAEWINGEWYSGEVAGDLDEGMDPQPTDWQPLPEPPYRAAPTPPGDRVLLDRFSGVSDGWDN